MPTAQHAVQDEVIYVDTSIWIALLAREPSSGALAQWLETAPALCCADWTQVEMASALGIKHRRGELPLPAAHAICDLFASMMKHQVHEITLTTPDVLQARIYCMDMLLGLRAGDALHLAVATRSMCSHFFSFDQHLNRCAERMGLRLTTL